MNALRRTSLCLSLLAALAACGPAKAPSSAEPKATALKDAPPPRVPTPATALLVLSKRDHTLAIVDPNDLHVVNKIQVGEDPHEVIASTDGKTAYVSNYGRGAYHTLAVVDLVGQRALPPIELEALRGPHGLAFVGDKVWFTAEAAKVVARFDPKTQKVDWVMGTGQDRTHMIYVAKDASWIATSNVDSGSVSILDSHASAPPPPPPPPPATNAAASAPTGPLPPPPPPSGPDWSETVIPVGAGSEGFDVTPDGRELWVANAREGTVSVVDLASRKVVATLAAEVLGANRLKFTPNGHLALVSSIRSPELTILDTATRKVTKRVKVGRGSTGILMQPNGARAFVACPPDNSVVVFDLSTLEVTGRFEAGAEPDGMAWALHP